MTAMAMAQWKVEPGRAPEFIALMKELKQINARHGLSLRVIQLTHAGANTGLYASVAEAADLVALATGLQNRAADPEAQALGARYADVCTTTSLSQATEVPL